MLTKIMDINIGTHLIKTLETEPSGLQPVENRNRNHDVLPADTSEHSVHTVLARTADALALLPHVTGITGAYALTRMRQDHQLLLMQSIARADSRNMPSLTLDACEAACTDLVNVFLTAGTRTHVAQFTRDERNALLNILAATTKNKSPAIETLYAALSTHNMPPTGLLDYLEETADKFHRHPHGSVRTARIRLLQELHALARHCGHDYSSFMGRAQSRLQTYLDARCADMDIPPIGLEIVASHADYGPLQDWAAWLVCPTPQDFLAPRACKIRMHDTLDTPLGQAPLLHYVMCVLEHELVHAQSFFLRCRSAASLYTGPHNAHASQYPSLGADDPRIKLFWPLWYNTDTDGLLMNGRYYSTAADTQFIETYINAIADVPDCQKSLKDYLYHKQAEEIAAHHAEQITVDYILGPALAAQARPSHKPAAPRLP